jgi:hypothetical protein
MHQKIDHRSPISTEDLKEFLQGLEEHRDVSLNNLTCRTLVEEVIYLRQLNDGQIPETEAARGIRSLLKIVADYQDAWDGVEADNNDLRNKLAAAEAFIKDAKVEGLFGGVEASEA